MNDDVLLSCTGVCKNFGATRALVNVDFELKRGEVCGLIGENGSGKSTLTSIFAGVQSQTSGSLFREGKSYSPTCMVDAQKAGVAMIVQEIGTLPTIDVAANTASSKTGDKSSLQHFTTTARQAIIFEEMKKITRGYLDLWYIG